MQVIIIIIYLPLSKAQYRLSLRTQVVIENRCEQCMNYTDGICSQMKSLSFSLNIFFIDVFLICPPWIRRRPLWSWNHPYQLCFRQQLLILPFLGVVTIIKITIVYYYYTIIMMVDQEISPSPVCSVNWGLSLSKSNIDLIIS